MSGDTQRFPQPHRSAVADEALLEDEQLADNDDEDDEHGEAPVREGLPPTFRMRHDAHYVEQLTERAMPHPVRLIPIGAINRGGAQAPAAADVQVLAESMRDVGVLQPLLVRPAGSRFDIISGARRLEAATVAGLRHVPCIVHDADDAKAESLRSSATPPADAAHAAPAPGGGLSARVADALAESLEAASACLSLNGGRSGGTFAGRVALDLVAVELQRATRAARAAALLASPPSPAVRDLLLGTLVHDVVAITEAARRLTGVRMEVAIADREIWMRADAQLLTHAMAGVVDALLLRLTGPGTIRVTVKGTAASPAIAIEIAAGVDGAAPAGLFDARDDHPWGPVAGLLLAAAARAVAAHGGHADAKATSPGDCTIAFVLPRR